ncbi:SLNL1-like protein [Mya arenaria]|uniref:SLNL1-like protein n=1 Tax=Mya arenaria TaxID=6604 RepID=A0ABY7F2G7_MYAAR|nr:SLNL1-like protein [Mya arenaria]
MIINVYIFQGFLNVTFIKRDEHIKITLLHGSLPLKAMAGLDSVTTVYVGNLKTSARILELKSNLLWLISKLLKVSITSSDISIVNGSKRYAIIDVHNEQNVEFILQNLSDHADRRKLNFNFETIVQPDNYLHVDTLKSQDEKQARDDFENAKNPLRPFQKPHLHVRKRPDYGRVIPLKSMTPGHTGRSSRQSSDTQRSRNPPSEPPTDLDVTLDDYPVDRDRSPHGKNVGEAINREINMVPFDDSTLKVDLVHNRTISSIHGEGDDEQSENSEYEDPPGSVIDLRHVSRPSVKGKITPRIHRRVQKQSAGNDTGHSKTHNGNTHVDEESGTPYYKPGEVVYNHDLSKEFKAYLDGKYTLKKIHDYVARCVCGFMNSRERGMLLIGVDRRGHVVGIDCDTKQEERYRRHFLEAVKEIFPPVFGEEYSIHFAPLLEENGRQHPSLKVIEIRVFPPESQELLYECSEGVFVRRNGSLTGPIKASHIQEWIKQKHMETFDRYESKEQFLKNENEKKDDMIRRQADTIMAQRSQIESQKQVIEGGKSCTIL